MAELYIGLMSGTSMDGVDAALCEFDGARFLGVRATRSEPYPSVLRSELLQLQRGALALPLARIAELDNAVAEAFAAAAQPLCSGQRIAAIGSHGQTVFHDPKGAASSLQFGNPSHLAARCGVPVVADFRRADIALGGHGAPLVPAFHHELFARTDEARAVLNLGGIANITLLPDTSPQRVTGWDTGPGNGLMDEWAEQHLGKPFDAAGNWAASGQVHADLLKALLADDYFKRPPPKSTGRDAFSLLWLRQRYPALTQLAPEDVQRTLCELTALSAVAALQSRMSQARRLLVCGGGAQNIFLMQRLTALLPQTAVETTGEQGLDPGWVEAAAFAWLAARRLLNLPGNLPAVTGASRAAVLGGWYAP